MPLILSIISLCVASLALYLNFKKDTHRVRIRTKYGKPLYADFLSVNNDSSFPVQIEAVGPIDERGDISWKHSVCKTRENEVERFPIVVGARTTLEVSMLGYSKSAGRYGYAVQLICGRTFVVTGTALQRKIAFELKF